MSVAGRKRLDRLEASVNPQELMSLWMDEEHSFGSHLNRLRALIAQPEGVYPLHLLPRKAEEAVRLSMKGHPSTVVELAVERAIRDIVFLWYLHSELNAQLYRV